MLDKPHRLPPRRRRVPRGAGLATYWTRQPGTARQRRVLLTRDVLMPAGDVAVLDDLSADELVTGGAAIFLDQE